ncbi:MAG: SUMF1/EgtB/PvdO family nonheme iron enzyme [Spirochaetes bacterium]|nr:SUMF1/EgtB/PvdO family nonheme iron enzyme [Spirochaetota bacterium]
MGIFDMSGNVFEWVWDWYASNYTTSSPYTDADSQGPPSGTFRVVRGGSWNNAASYLRAANRLNSNPWGTPGDIGLRPVRRP